MAPTLARRPRSVGGTGPDQRVPEQEAAADLRTGDDAVGGGLDLGEGLDRVLDGSPDRGVPALEDEGVGHRERSRAAHEVLPALLPGEADDHERAAGCDELGEAGEAVV